MKSFRQFSIIAAVVLLAISCRDQSPDPGPDKPGSDENKNAWMYEVMKEVYLYNNVIPSKNSTQFSLASEDYFTSLLSRKNNDGKTRNGTWRPYSYMERMNSSTKAYSGPYYGIEYVTYYFESDRSYKARILYVTSHSAAETAGLKRGDWITKINGQDISQDNYTTLKSGSGMSVEVYNGVMDNNNLILRNRRTVVVQAANITDINPIHMAAAITISQESNIGYFVYNSFQTNPESEGKFDANGPYNKDMKDYFRFFYDQGITELIVDLRYNMGGYVDCCRLLAGLINRDALGRLFVSLHYNANANPSQTNYYFHRPEELSTNQNLNLSRVIVLTSGWTASASELLISALSPYMEVVVIGDVTEGKNVGSNEYKSETHQIILHPITFQSFNASGQSDNYVNGFTPDITCVDIDNYDQMKDLGDAQEFMLRTAIDFIKGNIVKGTIVTKSAQRADAVIVSEPGLFRLKGAIIY